MAAFINSWQSLINGLSSQLAETKAELSKSRQLNEELSKQLNETTRQLADALEKFTECQKTMAKEPSRFESRTEEQERLCTDLGKPIHELSQAINDLRQWLPQGLASAASVAVQTQLGGRSVVHRPDDPSALVNLYGPNLQMGGVTPFPPFPYVPIPAVPANWPMPIQNPVPLPSDSHTMRFPPTSGSTTSPDLLPTSTSVTLPFQPALTQPRPSLRQPVNALGQLTTATTNFSIGPRLTPPNQAPSNPPVSQLIGPFNQPTLRPPQLSCLPPGQVSTVSPVNTVSSTASIFAPSFCTPNATPVFSGFRFSSPQLGGATPATTEKPSTQPTFGFGNLRLNSPQADSALFSLKAAESTPSQKAADKTIKSPTTAADLSSTDLHPEEEEPKVDFKPVLDVLPDQVEGLTGEEDEERVFNDRARLYRYDKASSSWKTRGVGDVRILHHSVRGTYRLVMRRDQVKKLCANHSLTAGLKISQHSKDPRMAMWAVKDFAESSEGKDELFMIQFKSAELLSDFIAVFQSCVAKSGSLCDSPSEVTPQKLDASAEGQSDSSPEAEISQPASSNQNEKSLASFLPKPGSWTCSTCLLNQSPDAQLCAACGTAKPGTVVSTSESKPPSGSASLFGGFAMSTGGFIFGQSKTPACTTTSASITAPKPLFSILGVAQDKLTISASNDSNKKETPLPFRFGTVDASSTAGDAKPTTSGGIFSSISLLSDCSKLATPGGFSFTFGLPSQSKDLNTSAKSVDSPSKSVHESDSDQVEQVDDSNLTFKPVLSVLPEKVALITGEENEEVIFAERAKLYRWDSGKWRERGVGIMKLLRTPDTGSVRCVMRRDHVLKVCCNHPVTKGMQLKPMSSTDGRALTWWAIDFTEPCLDEEQQVETLESGGRKEMFAIRFKALEHTEAFRKAFEEAASGNEQLPITKVDKLSTQLKSVDLDRNDDSDNSDVIIVEKPPKVNEEQLSRARALQLPDEFFSYENGVLSGVAESLTDRELAEEDELLDKAVRTTRKGTTPPIVSPSPCEKGDTKVKQIETPNKTTPAIQALSNGTPDTAPARGIFASSALTASSGLPDFSSLSATMSESAKPLWGQNSPSSWTTTCTPLFAKSQTDTNNSEQNTEDSTEHDPHYDPVIPLPDLIQAKSGEESEVCIFLRRCRLYRYTDKAWRERGIGEVKVLLMPQTMPTDYQPGSRDVFDKFENLGPIKSARLLMRRDQVLKLCLNQSIGLGVPSFTPMGATKLGLVWSAVDFSEGTANRETLAIRFKNQDDLDEFKSTVAKAQSLLPKS